MGNLKHTPEPWISYGCVIREDNRHEDQVASTNTKCDAERIVECVNAMAGIHDPERWMEEAKEVFNKVLDFEHPDLKIGESKIDFLIKLAENGSKKP